MRGSALAAVLAFSACGGAAGGADGDAAPGGGDGAIAEIGGGDVLELPDGLEVPAGQDPALAVPVACHPGTRWTPGKKAFAEATAEVGIEGAVGYRLSVTDLEGDGWPDLLVRDGEGPDVFAEGGERHRWVLQNDAGTFEDVTEASGLLLRRGAADGTGRPGEVMVSGDVDSDGDLDVWVGRSVPTGIAADGETSELCLNDGAGVFSLGPAASPIRFAGKPSIPAGATWVDYDRDGHLDLWTVHNMGGGMSSPLQDRLFRGDGAGGFEDVTDAVGLTTSIWTVTSELNAGLGHSWAWSSAACDLDGDGLQELLAASYGRAPNHLWRAAHGANGVFFENVSVSSGYAYDDRLDWTTNQSARCWCLDHPADEDCDLVTGDTDPNLCAQLKAAFGPSYRWNHAGDREPWRLGGNSATTVCRDLDHDGDTDLVTSEIVHWDVGPSSDPAEVLVNTGEADLRFERPGDEALGITRFDPEPTWDHGDMTALVVDFDNDGWPDLYRGSSDYPYAKAWLYHQEAPLSFEWVPFEDSFEHKKAHGAVALDLDRDGDLDLALGHSHMRCDVSPPGDCYPTRQVRVFRNLMGDAGSNWLQVDLEGGPGSNRAALGARVEVTAGGFTQTREVDGGHGHFGTQEERVLHFGLGAACAAEVRVRWPDAKGTEETWVLGGGARYRLVQGSPPVRRPAP